MEARAGPALRSGAAPGVKDVLEIFFEIILAIAGAVFFGSLTVAVGAFVLGCVIFGSCWSFLGWRRRRAARLRQRD